MTNDRAAVVGATVSSSPNVNTDRLPTDFVRCPQAGFDRLCDVSKQYAMLGVPSELKE